MDVFYCTCCSSQAQNWSVWMKRRSNFQSLPTSTSCVVKKITLNFFNSQAKENENIKPTWLFRRCRDISFACSNKVLQGPKPTEKTTINHVEATKIICFSWGRRWNVYLCLTYWGGYELDPSEGGPMSAGLNSVINSDGSRVIQRISHGLIAYSPTHTCTRKRKFMCRMNMS